jgi:hypothetical protein
MNGKKAKAIRRAVYGDQSLRQKREYESVVLGRSRLGTIRNVAGSLRSRYQKAKRTANTEVCGNERR